MCLFWTFHITGSLRRGPSVVHSFHSVGPSRGSSRHREGQPFIPFWFPATPAAQVKISPAPSPSQLTCTGQSSGRWRGGGSCHRSCAGLFSLEGRVCDIPGSGLAVTPSAARGQHVPARSRVYEAAPPELGSEFTAFPSRVFQTSAPDKQMVGA